MDLRRSLLLIVALAGALVLTACSATTVTPPASPSASVSSASFHSLAPTASTQPPVSSTPPGDSVAPSASPSAAAITSPAQAAALVLASDPRFASVTLRTGAAGQTAFYVATATLDGYSVAVTLGSGDCQSGCINMHTWTFAVAPNGDIVLAGEEGDEVEVASPTPNPAPATVTVSFASMVCPVGSPAASCAPIGAGMELIVRNPAGAEITRATTDANGRATLSVPGGAYFIEPASGDSLRQSAAFSVVGGDSVGVVIGLALLLR